MQQGRHDLLARRHHIDLKTTQAHVIGELAADQAGPEDQYTLLASRGSTQTCVVFQIIDREHMISPVPLDRHLHSLRAPGQHQIAILHRFFANPQALVARVDTADTRVGADNRLELLGHGPRLGHAQAVRVLLLGEAGRKHGLGIGATVVGGNQQQRRIAIELAKLTGEVIAGQAGPDDDHGGRHFVLSSWLNSMAISRWRSFQSRFCRRRNRGTANPAAHPPTGYPARCRHPAILGPRRRSGHRQYTATSS
ncbi:hypothetical protein D3C79_704670 [compost metagenome]